MRKSVRSTPRVVLLLTLLWGGPLIPSPTLGQVARDEGQERLQEPDRLNQLIRWFDLNQQLRRLYEQGRYREALELAQEVLAIDRQLLGEEHPAYATNLNNLAELYRAMGANGRAEPLLRQALEIWKKALGEEHPLYATGLNDLALLYYDMGAYDRAEPLYRQALEIRKKALGEEHPDYATSLNNLAGLYRAMGAYGRAEPLYRQALEIRKKALGEEHPVYAQSLDNLAVLYDAMGAYGRAEPLYRQALEIWKKAVGEEHPDYAISLNNLATLYYDMGAYDRAEPLYRQALEIWKKALGEEHPAYATSLSSLAELYSAMGAYDRAEPLHRQALEIRKKALGEGHPDYAGSLNNLAALYCAMGAYVRAVPLYHQALAIRKEALGEGHPDYAQSLHNLAALFCAMGAYDRAEPLYRQALEIRKKAVGEEHPDYAISLNNLAELYRRMGAYDRAEPLVRQALEIWKKAVGEGHPAYAQSLNNLAGLYRAMGAYDRAEPLVRQALEVTKKAVGEEHLDYAQSLGDLALLYQATNRPRQALTTLGHALEVEQLNLRRVFAFSAEPAMRAYLDMVGHSLDLLLSMVLDGAATDPAAADTALTWTLRRKAVILQALCRFRDAQRLLARDPALAQQAAQLRGLRQRLSDWMLNPPPGAGPDTVRHQMEAWRRQADELEAELNRALARHEPPAARAEVEAAALRRRLPAGSALVELVRVDRYDFRATGKAPRWKPAHYLAFVVAADAPAPPRLIDLGEAADIDAAVDQVRQSVIDAGRELAKTDKARLPQAERTWEEGFRQVSRPLYHQVFAPLRAALGPATLIYLAADGELNRLPFEALVDQEGRYLLETYRFAYLSSGRDLLPAHPPPGRGTVVFAGPDYDLGAVHRHQAAQPLLAAVSRGTPPGWRGARSEEVRGLPRWRPLAGAAQEADLVRQALQGSGYGPVKVYPGPEALEEVFKAVHGPRLLHVATHGFFLPDQQREPEAPWGPFAPGLEFGAALGLARLHGAENPLLRSGLVLAGANTLGEPAGATVAVDDGWVTAEEIALMDLRGTELVVLSACETGLGRVMIGEGVYGLRRAFLYAGARTLVTSLFQVPDEQTRQLMERFYGALKAGRGKLEALHGAQVELLRQRRAAGGAAHPFFWASFVLVGDPE